MNPLKKEKIAEIMREMKKRTEILIPAEEEKEEIKETLKKLFAENFLTYSAFIVNTMFREEEKIKPILSISGGYVIGKTTMGNLIGKLSADYCINISPVEIYVIKNLSKVVLTNKVVVIDDIEAEKKEYTKRVLKFLEKYNSYSAFGLTTADTYFICISDDDHFFANWKMKDAVIPTFLNKNDFAKQNIERLYRNDEWILKTRGFYFSLLPEVSKGIKEVKWKEIYRSCGKYVKVAYVLSKILGDEYDEFNTINSEFEFEKF